MSGLDDVRAYVVRPACMRLGMWSIAAEHLVLGTGLTESQYKFLDQTTPGVGPAYGPWQMEKATHDDLWVNYIAFQPSALRTVVLAISGETRDSEDVPRAYIPPITTLHWNLLYGAAMCRLHYRRVRATIPAAEDYVGMAGYWKEHYNTVRGRGTIVKALPFFRQVCSL